MTKSTQSLPTCLFEAPCPYFLAISFLYYNNPPFLRTSSLLFHQLREFRFAEGSKSLESKSLSNGKSYPAHSRASLWPYQHAICYRRGARSDKVLRKYNLSAARSSLSLIAGGLRALTRIFHTMKRINIFVEMLYNFNKVHKRPKDPTTEGISCS